MMVGIKININASKFLLVCRETVHNTNEDTHNDKSKNKPSPIPITCSDIFSKKTHKIKYLYKYVSIRKKFNNINTSLNKPMR